jgi:hypothetical protein
MWRIVFASGTEDPTLNPASVGICMVFRENSRYFPRKHTNNVPGIESRQGIRFLFKTQGIFQVNTQTMC